MKETKQAVDDVSANDIARDKWVEENYPDGEEVPFDQCNFCDSWIVGERRCSCGNRRVYLEIEGNAIDGFFAYPMAD